MTVADFGEVTLPGNNCKRSHAKGKELKWRAKLLNAVAEQSGALKRSAGRARLRRAATRSIAKFSLGKIRAGLQHPSNVPQIGASAEMGARISRPCQCSIFTSTVAAKISVPANEGF
jgi:hypothetical protein